MRGEYVVSVWLDRGVRAVSVWLARGVRLARTWPSHLAPRVWTTNFPGLPCSPSRLSWVQDLPMRPFYPNLSQVAKGLTARRKMSRNIDNISPIYRVLEASNTTFRGDMSEDRFFANNCQKIGNISVISDKSVIFRKNHLERQLIANFFTKNRPSLQRDLTAQITPVLIRRPNLNLNGNKEI